MDNLAAHKKAGVREAIQSCGATLVYLPPYRPDFHPIELVFAKRKGLLRSAEERTVPDLWQRLGKWIDRFAPQEGANEFHHGGDATKTGDAL